MKTSFFAAAIFFTLIGYSQYAYEPSEKNPYGLLNPKAPRELADYAPLIGTCSCKSVARISQTEWADTVDMKWTFKYIMDGLAIQDETLKYDGSLSGSIRQFNSDSAKWYVHYYASATPTSSLSSWNGGMDRDDKMILYKDQTAPNGMEGYFKITFSNISDEGFNWLGEWVDKTESFSYPTWKIYCKKNSQ